MARNLRLVLLSGGCCCTGAAMCGGAGGVVATVGSALHLTAVPIIAQLADAHRFAASGESRRINIFAAHDSSILGCRVKRDAMAAVEAKVRAYIGLTAVANVEGIAAAARRSIDHHTTALVAV